MLFATKILLLIAVIAMAFVLGYGLQDTAFAASIFEALHGVWVPGIAITMLVPAYLGFAWHLRAERTAEYMRRWRAKIMRHDIHDPAIDLSIELLVEAIDHGHVSAKNIMAEIYWGTAYGHEYQQILRDKFVEVISGRVKDHTWRIEGASPTRMYLIKNYAF